MAGQILEPGQGRAISLPKFRIAIKVDSSVASGASVFELHVDPGFDVGAHRHAAAEETFYVLEGELDLRVDELVTRGRPGSLMFVPRGAVHQFLNASPGGAKVLLAVSPSGHERYFEELADILAKGAPPDQDAIAALRERFETEQVTPLTITP
jgi:quercetin dioxygenase-like cupin family protein